MTLPDDITRCMGIDPDKRYMCPERHGDNWPANHDEMGRITQHAHTVRRQILADGRAVGLADADITAAIRRYRHAR